MVQKLFIGVFNKSQYRKDTYMSKFHNEEALLTVIANLTNSTLERVFTVDEFGEVEFYEVVFQGKLKLKKLGKGAL
jgi:hypothetical protein